MQWFPFISFALYGEVLSWGKVGGHMKLRFISTLIFFLIHISCAMQQVSIHQDHSLHGHTEVIVIEIPAIEEHPHRQSSEEREHVRYTHKKKLACIGLLTALIAGGTAVTIYLTK